MFRKIWHGVFSKTNLRTSGVFPEKIPEDSVFSRTSEGKRPLNRFLSRKSLIDAMEHEIFTNWADKVPETSKTHLSKSLLTIRDDQLLDINFDPQLIALLRETRYIIIVMKRTDLPEEAIQLYYRTQYFFESTYNLNLIVQR